MLRSGGAAIHMKSVELLAGIEDMHVSPRMPFDRCVVDFLSRFSSQLMKFTDYPDIVSLGYYCRKSNITALKKSFDDGRARLGRGLVFHIAPSNVPVNFAFSYLFGLLAGNANVVRVPSKEYRQTGIICQSLRELFEDFPLIKASSSFVKYSHDDQVTAYYSSICHGRIIWGGDQTIQNIRKFPLPPRSMDITFADRYSLCILDAQAVLKLDGSQSKNLARRFYNDTYLIDQNACSSPQLILWQGEEIEKAQEKFWTALLQEARRYELADVNAIDKYTQLCCAAIDRAELQRVCRYENLIYTLSLKVSPDDLDCLRGKYGLFYQYNLTNWDEIAPLIGPKVQTLTYFGVEPAQLIDAITNNGLLGIDRVVPVGKALDIGVVWDGIDMIGMLSRVIEVV